MNKDQLYQKQLVELEKKKIEEENAILDKIRLLLDKNAYSRFKPDMYKAVAEYIIQNQGSLAGMGSINDDLLISILKQFEKNISQSTVKFHHKKKLNENESEWEDSME